jgi:long-subunit fatty acid transport protein
MNKIITILVLNFSLIVLHGQNEIDALRYSQITFGGTARYNAMGGSFGALGGDFSTLSSNPAGIALFRRNEITLTPSIIRQMVNSKSNNVTNNTDNTAFKFQNAGFVWVFNPFNSDSKWRYMSAGFGYNRLADFSSSMNMNVNNASGSLTDVFLQHANGVNSSDLDPFNEGLAYNTYLIDNPKGGKEYFSNFQKNNVNQSKSLQTGGGMGETVLSVGGNYAGKLYLGVTLGFQNINYTETSSYAERSGADSSKISSFKFDQNLSTSGTGINFKIGAIYRCTEWMRIGAAFHSPTSLSLNDRYSSSMVVNFKDSTSRDASPDGNYTYKLITPPRFIGSLGFVISKKGLLNLDYEFVNYAYSHLSSTDAGVFDGSNNFIQQNYSATSNIRIGGEWRMFNFLSLRAGFAYYGNPYNSRINVNASRKSYSAGLGFREKNFYVDFAYVLMQYSDNYFLNDPTYTHADPIANSFSSGRTMITFGFKF